MSELSGLSGHKRPQGRPKMSLSAIKNKSWMRRGQRETKHELGIIKFISTFYFYLFISIYLYFYQ